MIWVLIPLSQFSYQECYNFVSLRFRCYNSQVTEASALQQEQYVHLWLVMVLLWEIKMMFFILTCAKGPSSSLAARTEAGLHQRIPGWTAEMNLCRKRTEKSHRAAAAGSSGMSLETALTGALRQELRAQEMFEWCCSLLSFHRSHPLTWASLSALKEYSEVCSSISNRNKFTD